MILSKFKRLKPYYKSTFLLAGPVIISQLGYTLVHMADSVVVGHFLGTIPLAAVSLVHSVFMVVLVIGLGIAYGITPLIAQANGRGDKQECATLLANSLWLNLITSILLFLLVYYGSVFAVEHLDQDPQVVEVAKPYLFILSLSIIPLMIFNAFKQFAEGLGFTKQAMNISIWGNVLNIILAIVFVKGMFGIESMGISGVGYSTLIDRVMMMIAMGIYVFKGKVFSVYIQYFQLFKVEWDKCVRILKIGAPVAMQYVFEIGAFAGAALIAGTIGATEQASHQVGIQLASLTYMMASGIATAATIKTGNSFGNGNFVRLQRYAISSYHLVILFMCCTATLFAVFNQYLPYIFTQDIAVVTIAAQLLIIAGLFQLFDGVQVVGLGVLRGIGDVNVPTFITFFAYWIVGMPAAYVMGIVFKWGVIGIWYGLSLGLLTSSVLLYWRYRVKIKIFLAGQNTRLKPTVEV